jgi:hypothetical protein
MGVFHVVNVEYFTNISGISKELSMPESLNDGDWDTLLGRIKEGKCTPFLGAGISYGILPLARDIAESWAKEHSYPMEDSYDLGSVAQYLSIIRNDSMFPKDKAKEFLERYYPNDFSAIEASHGFLATMPLPVYVTTNYDNFMFRALQSKMKTPKRVICKWNKSIPGSNDFTLEKGFQGNEQSPILFHLHGVTEVKESMVLTENDYIDFLVEMSTGNNSMIPPRIQEAITNSSLLFIGYGMKDWNFRVVFRGLVSKMAQSLRRMSIAVQLNTEDKGKKDYLDQYFNDMNIRVFWGTAAEFINELKTRWIPYNAKR